MSLRAQHDDCVIDYLQCLDIASCLLTFYLALSVRAKESEVRVLPVILLSFPET